MRAAVIGAGIVGASAALSLARRGHTVSLFEQFPLGHRRGSSHGRTRIVRKAYPNVTYTRWMLEAYPLWNELESHLGKTFLHEVGLLHVGSVDAPDIVEGQRALQENNVPFSLIGPREDEFRILPGEVGIFTAEAGYCMAEAALRGSLELAAKSGVRVIQRRADPAALLDEFDAVLIAAGPWVRDWIPVPVKVTQQTFAYLKGKIDGPVWIEDGPALCYGFPSEPGQETFKIGVHRAGPEIDPASDPGEPDQKDIAAIRETAARRFGKDEVLEASTCRYTTTANDDFLLGRFAENGFFASACSGHGFKFGPWTGKLLADFAEGVSKPEDYPDFYWSQE